MIKIKLNNIKIKFIIIIKTFSSIKDSINYPIDILIVEKKNIIINFLMN